jgi:BirA family biotin operon repressor/biotin-[acetyl-CoA-carboxylase] ligase
VTAERVLVPSEVRASLETGVFGRRLYYAPEVDSTNRLARDLATDGERHGAVVLTDYQSAGRGRRDRSWASPPGRNLLFSIILRPERPAAEVLPLTLAFSLSLADVLSGPCGRSVGVKWPNDVVTDEGKLCGILSESTTRSGKAVHLIVGIGINVNMRRNEFPKAMVQPGASCFTLTGKELDRTALLADVLMALEHSYDGFLHSGFAALRQRYLERVVSPKEGMTVRLDGEERRVTIVGVETDGGLRVRAKTGEEFILYDEDVTPR